MLCQLNITTIIIITNVSIHGIMENGINMMSVRIESTLLNAPNTILHTTHEMSILFHLSNRHGMPENGFARRTKSRSGHH